MKIILLKDVKGVGIRGSIKDVADGYALNALVPQGLAAYASPEKVAEVERMLRDKKVAADAHNVELIEEAKMLAGANLSLVVRTNENGGLYSHITPGEVIHAIKQQYGFSIETHDVSDISNIKTTGIHTIHIMRGKERVPVTLQVQGH